MRVKRGFAPVQQPDNSPSHRIINGLPIEKQTRLCIFRQQFGVERRVGFLTRHEQPFGRIRIVERGKRALAVLADVSHAARSLQFVTQERNWLMQQLQAIPRLEPLRRDANYLYVRLGFSAGALCEHFLQHRILVRNCNAWPGLPGEAVRIAMRRHDENERLIQAWKAYRCD